MAKSKIELIIINVAVAEEDNDNNINVKRTMDEGKAEVGVGGWLMRWRNMCRHVSTE